MDTDAFSQQEAMIKSLSPFRRVRNGYNRHVVVGSLSFWNGALIAEQAMAAFRYCYIGYNSKFAQIASHRRADKHSIMRRQIGQDGHGLM